jgi:hypothetical protein
MWFDRLRWKYSPPSSGAAADFSVCSDFSFWLEFSGNSDDIGFSFDGGIVAMRNEPSGRTSEE